MNKIILTGRLTADPELRSTTTGKSVTTFTLAVRRNMSKQDEADFINCVAWNGTAEFVEKYFSKGKMIAVDGSLQRRSYEDKNGNKRYAYEVIVQNAEFCGEKTQDKPQTKTSPDVEYEEIGEDEDLPF